MVAIDVQPKMIAKLMRRLAKAGIDGRVDARVASPESMAPADLQGEVDFSLAFGVVHEFPDAERFFAELAEASKAGALLLLAEPAGHVNKATFEAELEAAVKGGSKVKERTTFEGA